MIYCGAAPDRCFKEQDEINTSLCTTDVWGIVDCSAAGCKSKGQEVCWNLYRSIVDSSFWTLMELFGEFPLVDQHSAFGKVLGTFTAVFAVAVFALPAGIFGSGFENQIARRRREAKEDNTSGLVCDGKGGLDGHDKEGGDGCDAVEVVGDTSTLRGILYNFFHLQNTTLAKAFDKFIDILVLGTCVTFVFDTVTDDYITKGWHAFFDRFLFMTVVVFSFEYVLRLFSAREDPKYSGCKLINYSRKFLPTIDLLAILPYWFGVFLSHRLIISSSTAQYFLLLRLLRFEKYTKVTSQCVLPFQATNYFT